MTRRHLFRYVRTGIFVAAVCAVGIGCDDSGGDNGNETCAVEDSPLLPSGLDGITRELQYDAQCPYYRVEGSLQLVNGARLEVPAGVTLVLGEDAEIRITGESSLAAVGTAEQPVPITGRNQTRGYHRGVNFVQSVSYQSELRHVIIEYGGRSGSDHFAANLYSDAPGLAVTDCVFRQSEGVGFWIEGYIHAFNNNTSTANRAGPGRVSVTTLSDLDGTNDFTGNDFNRLFVMDSGTLTENVSWVDQGVGLQVEADISTIAQLRIGAGLSAYFEPEAGLRAYDGGSLTIEGTAELPVLLAGTSGSTEPWLGVRFENTDNLSNVVNHTVIRDGGAGWGSPCLAVNNARVEVLNSTLRECAGYGFMLGQGAELALFAANTVTANPSGAGWVHPAVLGQLVSGMTSDFTGNTEERIVVGGGTSDASALLMDHGVPYFFESTVTWQRRLTVMPGAELRFDNAGLILGTGGALTAGGTVNAPVLFTGATATPGAWQGIWFDSPTADSELQYVIIEYGGGTVYEGDGPANLGATAGIVTITDSTIRYSAGWGIWGGSGHITPTNVTYLNNTSGDFNP